MVCAWILCVIFISRKGAKEGTQRRKEFEFVKTLRLMFLNLASLREIIASQSSLEVRVLYPPPKGEWVIK